MRLIARAGYATATQDNKPEDEQKPEGERLANKMEQMKEMKMMPTRMRPRDVRSPTQYGS